MAGFNKFFGLSGSDRADGLPPLPQAADIVDFTSSVRHVAIMDTTDSIRLPQAVTSPGLAALGYRRVDKLEGGASEWLVDWNAIASFTGGTLTSLDDGVYSGNCQVKGNTLYFGFQDLSSGITASSPISYLVSVNLTTGAIISVTPITATTTVISSTPVSSATTTTNRTFGGNNDVCLWWEINDSSQLVAYYADSTSTSSETNKGIAKVVYSSDLTSVVSEDIYFDSSQVLAQSFTIVDYVSEDGEIIVAHNSTVLIVAVTSSEQVITLKSSMLLLGAADLIANLANSDGGSVKVSNCITDNIIAVKRINTTLTGGSASNGNNLISRPFVSRSDLDDYLRQLVFNFSGVQL